MIAWIDSGDTVKDPGSGDVFAAANMAEAILVDRTATFAFGSQKLHCSASHLLLGTSSPKRWRLARQVQGVQRHACAEWFSVVTSREKGQAA
jgi:hypothetical protein